MLSLRSGTRPRGCPHRAPASCRTAVRDIDKCAGLLLRSGRGGSRPACPGASLSREQGGKHMLDRGRLMGFVAAVAVLGGVGSQAAAWSLEEAAAPYKGTTIRALFLDRPGYAAAIKILPEFEEK